MRFKNTHKHNNNLSNKTTKNYKHKHTNLFLSSCIQYYQKNIFTNSDSKKIGLNANIFLEKGPIYIIDYPNIIHILHEKYNERNKVIKCFYSFIHDQLTKKNAKIIIIAKMVVIEKDNIKYPISDVFLTGQTLTKKQIDISFFKTQQIMVFEFNYKMKISSSVDDLIGYFICVVLFTYLSKNGVNPIAKDFNGIQKLNMLTNDMQHFNKNLFGLTFEEQHGEKLNILEMNSNYKMEKNVKEKKWINTFVNEYMTTKSTDTYHLACLIIGLVNAELYEDGLKDEFDFKDFVFPTYNQFKNLMMERKQKLCKKEMKMQCVYLYVLIKCVQTKMFDENMFGSFSKDKIIEMYF
jgi:hypothetical protein